MHIEGQGPDLLLVSGLGGTASFWSPLVAALAARFRVVRFDQRGIGASTRGEVPVTIERLARDALSVLDHADSRSAVIVGHSTGGCIAQQIARIAPERMSRAVLSGTWLKPSRYMRELFRARLEILHAAPKAYAASGVFLSYPAGLLENDWSKFEAALAAAPMTVAQQAIVAERIDALLAFDGATYGPLPMPAFILGAEDDVIVPAFLQRELAAATPAAITHVFATGGHFFPLTRAAEFIDRLVTWAATPQSE